MRRRTGDKTCEHIESSMRRAESVETTRGQTARMFTWQRAHLHARKEFSLQSVSSGRASKPVGGRFKPMQACAMTTIGSERQPATYMP